MSKRIDFHAHILPGVDHGSSSSRTSLFQLEAARVAGIDGVIATSHFYPHRDDASSFLRRRDAAYRHLCHRIEEAGVQVPQIRLGAEVLLCPGMHMLPGLSDLAVRGTNVLLLELPFSDFSPEYCDTVENILSMGLQVVLAHADRYDPQNIRALISLGAKIQLNADALSGLFVRRPLREWIAEGYVCALGSDIHGEDRAAYRRYNRAEHRLGAAADAARAFMTEVFDAADPDVPVQDV